MTSKSISSSTLKLIAMFAMLIDHIAWVLFPLEINMNILSDNWIANSMHMIGRLAFPVFAFCIAEGYLHSHDLKNYLKRLGMLAFISILPFSLIGWVTGIGFITQNTVFTLFLGLCALYFSDRQQKTWKKVLIVLFCFALSVLADGGLGGGVFGIYAFAKIKNPTARRITGFAALISIQLLLLAVNFSISGLAEPAIAFAGFLLVTSFYNGRKGPSIGKLFYYFYPLHLLVLALLRIGYLLLTH
ncbi:TraX family protein [Streptococcus sp. DD11]|uniref:TraX family protein n=1 Tax=Streptococcus sp. DD11 TaxID=1777879 RepID=UPI000AB91A8A|nr:TraX family protein [Streptococcus sp. DD11]